MALAELIGRLERDAERRIAGVRDQAAASVARLKAEAAQRRSQTVERELAARRAARAARLGAELAQARQRSRRDRLTAQHAAVDAVLARARALTGELGASPAYAAVVLRHLELALRYLEGSSLTVRCRPQLAAAVRAALVARGDTVVLEAEDAPWGVTLEAAGGAVRIAQTLDAALRRGAPSLAVELGRELFP